MFEAILLITAISGLALSAGSMYMQTQQANAVARNKAKVADNNAKMAEMEGQYAKRQAHETEMQHRRKVAAILSEQRAAMGASGLEIGAGTFGDILDETLTMGEIDALAIRHEGDMAAWRAQINADNARAAGAAYAASQSSPFLASAGTLVTGAGNIGLNYYASANNPAAASTGAQASSYSTQLASLSG